MYSFTTKDLFHDFLVAWTLFSACCIKVSRKDLFLLSAKNIIAGYIGEV